MLQCTVKEKGQKIKIWIKLFIVWGHVLMIANINMRQYVNFIKPRNFDTADIKCFTVFISDINKNGNLVKYRIILRRFCF